MVIIQEANLQLNCLPSFVKWLCLTQRRICSDICCWIIFPFLRSDKETDAFICILLSFDHEILRIGKDTCILLALIGWTGCLATCTPFQKGCRESYCFLLGPFLRSDEDTDAAISLVIGEAVRYQR